MVSFLFPAASLHAGAHKPSPSEAMKSGKDVILSPCEESRRRISTDRTPARLEALPQFSQL